MIPRATYRLVLALLFCSTLLFSQQRSSNVQNIEGKDYYIHKIDKKQSLYAISKLYNVTLDELYKINPELKSGYKVGQEIRVPLAPELAPAFTQVQIDTAKYLTYKVGK